MDEIERIAKKLSDKLWQFTNYEWTFHWVAIADTLLFLAKDSGNVIGLARKLEFGTYAELASFTVRVGEFCRGETE